MPDPPTLLCLSLAFVNDGSWHSIKVTRFVKYIFRSQKKSGLIPRNTEVKKSAKGKRSHRNQNKDKFLN